MSSTTARSSQAKNDFVELTPERMQWLRENPDIRKANREFWQQHYRGLRDSLKGDFLDPNRDVERITGSIAHQASKSKQSRDGRILDLATVRNAASALSAASDVAGPAHRQRIAAELQDFVRNTSRSNASKAAAKLNMSRNLRTRVGTIIDVVFGEYVVRDINFLSTLVHLEAEIAFFQKDIDALYHPYDVHRVLPDLCEMIGIDAVHDAIREQHAIYVTMYEAAAVAAIESDTAFQVPHLINGREIGERHRLSCHAIRLIFPKGQHGIRGFDRDALDAAEAARRPRATMCKKRRTAEDIRFEREVAAFYGVGLKTAQGWKTRQPSGEVGGLTTWHRKVEAMRRTQAGAVTGVTPPVANFLIVDNKHGRDYALSRHPDVELTDSLRWSLAYHFGVSIDTPRQWKRRGKLAAKVAEFQRQGGVMLEPGQVLQDEPHLVAA